ncbi:S-layer homology domain-containing protein [Oscillibacter sp.]|uniref:S-layer homology domain-containing protein n=1 Tax=Oscillibacter sp. TaxID=1945593 RepID=UPI002897CE4A|nr:S-layer homology domain-containing protein [Oscillibacter sp.]
MSNKLFRRGTALLLSALLSVSLILPAAADETVPPPAGPDLSGLSVSFRDGTSELLLNESSRTVTAVVSGAPTDSTVTYSYAWTSGNTAVASVSGVEETVSILRGERPGRTDVSVTVTAAWASDPAITNSATISRSVLLPGIVLSSASLSMKTQESRQLTASVFLPIGIDETVTWSSSNELIARVSSSGLVTAGSAGTAIITATAGAYSATCQVTAEEAVANVITESARNDNPLAFSYVAGRINTECSRVLQSSLSYVTGLYVPASAGTLYYGYVSEGVPGAGVGSNEDYSYSGDRGTRWLSDVTFVPKADFSGTAVIRYTGYDSSSTPRAFQGTIEVNVAAVSGISYSTTGRSRVDFNDADFSAVCQAATGHELQYVTFSLPSTSKGTLFYKYNGSDLDNKVTSGTAYYRSKSPLLSDVTFVPADGYSGTLSISYTGRDTNGNSFGGSVSITVSTSAGSRGNIQYSTSKNRSARFNASDFNSLCEDVLGVRLQYVRFTLPASSVGTLRYNYSSSSSAGSYVSSSTSYYRSSSPYLDNVYFVPASGWTGTADISFTGYGSNSQSFTGVVTVDVDSTSSSGTLSYSTRRDTAVRFDVDDFNTRCDDETGQWLNYVSFTLPSSSYGTLRYNYYSSSSTGSSISSSTNYYRSSSPYLDNVYFVPASGWSGTVDISFTGYSTGGQRFTGTVRVTVRDSAAGGVSYSTKQDTPVNFSANDFDTVCREETDRNLNYVRFTLPSSSVGTLRYNYSSSSSTGSAVSASTGYYRSSSPYLSNVTFVPASGWSGTATISYTGYDTSGQRYTGSVSVEVKQAASAGVIYYTVSAGKAAKFDVSAFQLACSARGAGSFVSAAFSQPSSSVGQLRYQYTSSSAPGTAVTSGATYSASGSPLVSNLSFVPAAGYTGTATIPYTGKDSQGNSYSGSVVVTVTSDAKASSFTDMGNYTWASSSVEYLYSAGVVNGTGGGAFSPGAAITRGSFMLMLGRAFQFTASGGPGFADVPAGSVYAEAVKIAQALGIAQGSGSSFYPTQPLSRQQAAVFLARAMRASGWSLTAGSRSDLSGFSDSAAVSDYAAADLAAMVRLGVFQGGSNGKLNPQSSLTRAQMAVILCRAITL